MKKLSKLSLNKEKITALNSAQMNYLRGGGVTARWIDKASRINTACGLACFTELDKSA